MNIDLHEARVILVYGRTSNGPPDILLSFLRVAVNPYELDAIALAFKASFHTARTFRASLIAFNMAATTGPAARKGLGVLDWLTRPGGLTPPLRHLCISGVRSLLNKGVGVIHPADMVGSIIQNILFLQASKQTRSVQL